MHKFSLNNTISSLQKLVCILFLSVHLLTNTELCQLVKMPVLISHYKEHKVLYKNISFFGFIKMHYFNGGPHDATDMKLPFKTTSVAIIIHNSPSAPVPVITPIPSAPASDDRADFSQYYSSWIPSVSSKDIFQPPRHS